MRALALRMPCALLVCGCAGAKGTARTVILTTGNSDRGVQLSPRFRVPSGSMEPTLKVGERVQLGPARPRVGEIVVFHPPQGAELEQCGSGTRITPGGAACAHATLKDDPEVKFVKRIVAGPGDTITVIEGHVVRNGVREPDSYIRPCSGVSECNFPVAIKVPAGAWYLLGDNRGESDDSGSGGPFRPPGSSGSSSNPAANDRRDSASVNAGREAHRP